MNRFSLKNKIPTKNKKNPFPVEKCLFKNGQIKDFSYRLNWTEDTYVLQQEEIEALGNSFDLKKIRIILLLFMFFILVLLSRVTWLQIIKGEYYYSMAEGNRIRVHRIEAKRGVMYDRNENILTRNVANFMLYFVPADLPSKDEELNRVLKTLSGILDERVRIEEMEDLLKTVKRGSLESYRPLFVVDNIDYEKALLLKLETEKIPGVIISNKTRREYNFKIDSLSHILGYTGKINQNELDKFGSDYWMIDYIGKMGIELFWETEMRGSNGKKYVEVDALGKEKKIINLEDPIDGNNLILTLDINVQKKLEEISQKYLDEMNLSKAVGIVLNPQNGEILALLSLPAFDNNLFARGISFEDYNSLINDPNKPLFNRAIGGEYPPGSTIKPMMAASALQAGVVNENTSFLSTGGLRVGQWFFPDWQAGGHGRTNVKKAIAESVNTYFYYIGGGYDSFEGLGLDNIIEYGKKFGLGFQSGIDLPGEASGFLPSREWKKDVLGEPWYIGNTYHLSIGQGNLSATPLQIVNITSFFANGGNLYNPRLIKKITTAKNEPYKDLIASPIRNNFISNRNLETIKQGMRETIVSGSGRRLSSLPVSSAGKTGTAQWSSQKKPHAWFTGFAPYEKPEIAYVFLVEEGEEGSRVTVSIAYDFLDWYFNEYKNKDIE